MARLSFVLPDLRGGGAERVQIDLGSEFARAGHKVEFALMQARGELLEEARESFPIVNLSTPRSRGLLLALAQYLRTRRPDALICAMWPLTVIAPLAARISGHCCRVLVSEHGILSAQYCDWGRLHRIALRASMAVGYRLADRRVAVSKGLAADIAALSGLRQNAFEVIHNPVRQQPRSSREAIRAAEKLWSGPQGARILSVGALKPVKNHPLLVRAFARLNRPDARLMIVGEGAGREDLLLLARELGVADRVVLPGFKRETAPFYETADLFALSSQHEGFGNVIVEALGAGIPVVSTDCPAGPAEILQYGRFGRLSPVGNELALTGALEAALNAPVDQDALIRRASDFAPEIVARKYLNLLDQT